MTPKMELLFRAEGVLARFLGPLGSPKHSIIYVLRLCAVYYSFHRCLHRFSDHFFHAAFHVLNRSEGLPHTGLFHPWAGGRLVARKSSVSSSRDRARARPDHILLFLRSCYMKTLHINQQSRLLPIGVRGCLRVWRRFFEDCGPS